MTAGHSLTAILSRAGIRPAAAAAVLGAAAVLALAISLIGRGGTGGADGQTGLGETVTVPPVPADMMTGMPGMWTQPRGHAAAGGVWGPDVTAPFDTLWRIRTTLEFFAAPAFCGDMLFFGGNDGRFRAVEALTGEEVWSFPTACGLSGEAAVDSSAVYFGGQDGYLYALGRSDGRRLWSAGLGYHLFSGAGLLGDALVVAGNSDGSVAALRRSDGSVAWHDQPGGVILGPVVVDTVAVFTSEDGIVCAYGESGRRLWLRDFPGLASPPSASDSSVFVSFSDGMLRKLDLSDGSARWEVDLVEPQVRCVLSRPVVAGGRVLVGTCDGRLLCVSSSDGSVAWESRFENWVQVPPAAGDSTVYVACDDQRFHVLDASDGSTLAVLEMGSYSGSAPLVVNGVIYVGTAGGDFFAFQGTPRVAVEPVPGQD